MLIKHMQKRCLMHRLFLIYSWVGASSQTLWIAQVSDILYLSLSITADRLLPVNKVEIVEKRTHLRNDIRSFCQITQHYKRVYCGGVYHLCKSSSHRSVFPGHSRVQKQITDFSSLVSISGFNKPVGNSNNTCVHVFLEVVEPFNNFCIHQGTETAPNGAL